MEIEKEGNRMAVHINEVFGYMDNHLIGSYSDGFKSLMEILYEVYCEYNDINSAEIREIMNKDYDIVEDCPAEKEEQLYQLISVLCEEYEVLAFSYGILVGMNLMTEINMLP